MATQPLSSQPGTAAPQARPWQRFYNPTAAALTVAEPFPLTRLLDRAVASFGDRPFLTYGADRLSYDEVARLVGQVATGLAGLGIMKGDRVGYMAPAHPSFTIFSFALWHLGAVGVGLNPLYPVARLAGQAQDSGLKAVVTLDAPELLAKAEALVAALGRPVTVVVASAASGDPTTAVTRPTGTGARWVAAGDLIDGGAVVEAAAIDPLVDLAVLQYTGGTTGSPKAAMLSHGNLSVNAVQMHSWFPQLEPGREIMLSAAPVTHVSGVGPIQNFTVHMAGELVSLPRFDPARTLDIIEEHRISVLLAAPTMFVGILQAAAMAGRKIDWSFLKSAQCGAAPVSPELKKRFEAETGVWITTIYGMTETSPAAVYSSPAREHVGATGIPLPFTDVEIRAIDDPTKRMPAGEVGEICIKGPQVMRAYWNRPEATESAFVDGFFRSGDLGSMTQDGVVTLADRLKDVIIAGGYNIYPTDVENAILEHPDVREVAVIGVPDDYRGETVKAIVSLRSEGKLTLEVLQAFLRTRLSPMEIPKKLEVVDEIPRNENLKISRQALREREG
jgi:long-chain acyl-CoA synthetase